MKTSICLAVIICSLYADIQAAPSDVDNEVLVSKKVYKKGVSANFGGYHASAGLGGGSSGGGLYASAGLPDGTGAGAGLFGGAGSGASASAGVGGGASAGSGYYGGQQSGGGFFDKIFAIPVNVLHSVNGYVKTKGVPAGKVGASAGAGAAVSDGNGGLRFAGVSEHSVGTGNSGFASSSASASTGGSAGAGLNVKAGTAVDGQHVYVRNEKTDEHYDRVFDIPITALKSVNDFLNG